ncbi:MAG: neutral/alkaline non-lysosomal ceramidase N-terminal domain-containing protein [Planctomycetaceae bacterium]|nr:neutral/alkaline non-lysosomal ceramidase N-terminal domain-containing protein [Planctomycetaceae bacterium]
MRGGYLRTIWAMGAFLLAGTVGLFCTKVCLAHAASWQAGVARVAITPEHPMWMSGYAGRNQPAEGKLHDLWAKAIVLKSPTGQTGVLISLDLVGISRTTAGQITQRLQERFGLNRDQVALCTSHTHCGPVLGETLASMYFLDAEQQQRVADYTAAFPGKIVDLVGVAIASLEPVTLSYGVGETDFAVNRRENPEAEVPQRRAAGELKGPVDHAVPTLLVKSPQGTVRAVLFGYACHATTLSFYQWCGDWPGFAQIALEKRYPGATALFVAGCGGDQNPLPRRTVELAESYGEKILAAVTALEQRQPTEITGELRTSYREIDLPFSQLPDRSQLEAEQASGDRYLASRAKGLLEILERDGKLPATYPYPVQVWSVGPMNMVFLGGEVVVDYSLRLKGDLNQPELWVAGYSNDVMAYIPSRRVLSEGGYEGARSMIYYGQPTTWAPQVETLIVEQVTRMMNASRASE